MKNSDCNSVFLKNKNLRSQLEKIYDPANEEDDMVEMEEERLRMREHVMNEVPFFFSSLPFNTSRHSKVQESFYIFEYL